MTSVRHSKCKYKVLLAEGLGAVVWNAQMEPGDADRSWGQPATPMPPSAQERSLIANKAGSERARTKEVRAVKWRALGSSFHIISTRAFIATVFKQTRLVCMLAGACCHQLQKGTWSAAVFEKSEEK